MKLSTWWLSFWTIWDTKHLQSETEDATVWHFDPW